MQYFEFDREAAAASDERQKSCASPESYGVVRASSQLQPLSSYIANVTGRLADDESMDVRRRPGEKMPSGEERLSWSGLLGTDVLADEPLVYEALMPDRGLEGVRPVCRQVDPFTLRVGRVSYRGNFHLDKWNNWILAVSGKKRAVLAHPHEWDCLQVEYNESSGDWRQSPLPVLHAREWLAAHCLVGSEGRSSPLALQHVFEKGDLLYIPSQWLHAIETAPGAHGWWTSINRFVTNDNLSCDDKTTLVDVGAWPNGKLSRPWVAPFYSRP